MHRRCLGHSSKVRAACGHGHRYTLMEVACARQASEGQQTKMEMVYQYLMGPRFRQRVQAIVEGFPRCRRISIKSGKSL